MQSTSRLRTAVLTALSVLPLAGFAASGNTFMNGQSIYGQPAAQGVPVRVVDLASTDREHARPMSMSAPFDPEPAPTEPEGHVHQADHDRHLHQRADRQLPQLWRMGRMALEYCGRYLEPAVQLPQ